MSVHRNTCNGQPTPPCYPCPNFESIISHDMYEWSDMIIETWTLSLMEFKVIRNASALQELWEPIMKEENK